MPRRMPLIPCWGTMVACAGAAEQRNTVATSATHCAAEERGTMPRTLRGGPDVAAALADLLGDDPSGHQQGEQPATDAEREDRLERGGHDQQAQQGVGRAVEPEA